jgi:hypothetical protein
MKADTNSNGSGRVQLPAVIPKIQLVPFSRIKLSEGATEWQVKKLIPSTGVGLVWGPSQSYKSFWVFDLAMHIALGWNYRGRRVHEGSVVYCAFEGGVGLMKRVEAFRRHHKLGGDDVPFYLQSIRLALVEHAKHLIEAISLQEIEPAVIVLDTLNRSMTGSENKDADMGAYLAAADTLRETFNCFVIIVHHCGWDASHSRGHTSLPFGVDVEIGITRPADLHTQATIKKMKDEEVGEVIASKLEKVVVGYDEDDERITSLVVIAGEEVKAASREMSKNAKTMYRILFDAGRLTTIEWHRLAREAGIGLGRRADLTDLKNELKDGGFVAQLGDYWSVRHDG